MSMNGGAAPGGSSSPDFRFSVVTSNTAVDNALRQRSPRSLPPWIDSYETRYGQADSDQLNSLHPPARSVLPQHNHAPTEPSRRVSKDGYVDWDRDPLLDHAVPRSRLRLPDMIRHGRGAQHGRKWDHLRSAEPVIVPGYVPANKGPPTTWNAFLQSSMYGHIPGEESEIVDVEVLDKLQPRFCQPMDAPSHPLDKGASRRRRTLALYKRVWNMILRHSLAPLAFRLTVLVTSIIALAIAARIYEAEELGIGDSAERTQSIVAVAVDCVAVPYIGYMLWDEYTGKPLGLRSAVQKVGLILLDLFFIIFKSASTALAFESLSYHNKKDGTARSLAKGLASFMLVGLISWTMTFTVNVFRTVERLGGGDEDDHL